jgi:hypothetical protein
MDFLNDTCDNKFLSDHYDELYNSIECDRDIFVYDIVGEEVQFHIDQQTRGMLPLIERFVREVEKGKQAFSEKVGNLEVPLQRHRLAKYYDWMPSFLCEYASSKIFSPHVQAFFDVCVIRKQLQGSDFPKQLMVKTGCGKPAWEIFNDIVNEIKIETSSKKFKKKIYSQKEIFKKGFNSSRDYVNALFERHGRILVLRVDLSFSSKEPHKKHVVDLEEAQSYFSRFLNNRRSKALYRNSIGYIWRLEYGEKKGFHYHFFFFFNGSKSRKDEFLASRIGKHWEEITGGLGIYHNCNAHKQRYKNLAIGMISRDDIDQRKTIVNVLAYMHKEEQMLREKLSRKTRNWGKGNAPKVNDGRVGRPRGSNIRDDDQSAVLAL